MQLAKKEILGRDWSTARILTPAILLHLMGNFRGASVCVRARARVCLCACACVRRPYLGLKSSSTSTHSHNHTPSHAYTCIPSYANTYILILIGKKPLFKWGSVTPWVEMQLQAWSTSDDAPPTKVLCVCLFAHPIHPSVHSFMHSCIHAFMHSFIHSFKPPTVPAPPSPTAGDHERVHGSFLAVAAGAGSDPPVPPLLRYVGI